MDGNAWIHRLTPLYTEITGYAISCFLWIYSQIGRPETLEAANVAAQ
jgi:hypothetical protein